MTLQLGDRHVPAIFDSILGVNKNAVPDEVKQAYRKLVRQYHPDFNQSANAKATMPAINKAYQQFQQWRSQFGQL